MAYGDLITIAADINRLADCFHFRREGFGEALMDAAAEGILVAMDAQEDPDGNPWAPLSERYRDWKSRKFPGNPMAVLYGVMKTEENIRGQRLVLSTMAIMTFGTDDLAKQEAEWFQEGNENQPPRPFYAFTRASVEACDGLCDERFLAATR